MAKSDDAPILSDTMNSRHHKQYICSAGDRDKNELGPADVSSDTSMIPTLAHQPPRREHHVAKGSRRRTRYCRDVGTDRPGRFTNHLASLHSDPTHEMREKKLASSPQLQTTQYRHSQHNGRKTRETRHDSPRSETCAMHKRIYDRHTKSPHGICVSDFLSIYPLSIVKSS